MSTPPSLRKSIHQQFNDAATLKVGLTETQALLKQSRADAQHVVQFSSGDLEVQGVDVGEELARLGQAPGNGWLYCMVSGGEFEARLSFSEDLVMDGYLKSTDHEQSAALAAAIIDRLAAAASA
jgi:hypothetical protein